MLHSTKRRAVNRRAPATARAVYRVPGSISSAGTSIGRRAPMALRAVFAGPLLLLLVSANVPEGNAPVIAPVQAQPSRAQMIITELEQFADQMQQSIAKGSLPGEETGALVPFNRPVPFYASRGDAQSYARASDCLTAAIYYEAASESDAGQRAVAQVVLNRVYHPSWPNTVCGVVFQGSERTTGCQFTFTCDGALARKPSRGGWDRARRIAVAALNGEVFEPVGDATNYHTIWIRPWWAPSLSNLTTIGAHTFYRPHGRGTPYRDVPQRETISFAVMAERRAQPQPLLPAGATETRTALAHLEDRDDAPVTAEAKRPAKLAAAPLRALAMDETSAAPRPAAQALAAAEEPAAAASTGIRAL